MVDSLHHPPLPHRLPKRYESLTSIALPVLRVNSGAPLSVRKGEENVAT